MIKISDAIKKILSKNPFLEFGISHQLFNLSQLAKFIQPSLESRIKREIQPSAILMNLSRFQKKIKLQVPQVRNFEIENISVFSNVTVITYFKNQQIEKHLYSIHKEIQSQNGYFAFSESMSEITIFVDNKFLNVVEKFIGENPRYKNTNVSAVAVKFDEKYIEVPGLLYLLVQKLVLQNINFIEIASTYTEVVFYVQNQDTKLAFETLHEFFFEKDF